MDVKFQNSNPVSASGVGFCFNSPTCTPATFNKFEINGAETGASVPIGIRFGRFGESFGGDFEMSLWQHTISQQSGLSGTLDGSSVSSINLSKDYLKVTVFNVATGDLYVRVPISQDIIPYIGLGGGLALNNIQSTSGSVQNGSGQVLNQTSAGWSFRIPVGVRFKVGDRFGLFAEGRYVWNWVGFDRGFSGETDSVVLKGAQFLGGLSFSF
jgi:hypothetical protein